MRRRDWMCPVPVLRNDDSDERTDGQTPATLILALIQSQHWTITRSLCLPGKLVHFAVLTHMACLFRAFHPLGLNAQAKTSLG